jgi:hypothetical protein
MKRDEIWANAQLAKIDDFSIENDLFKLIEQYRNYSRLKQTHIKLHTHAHLIFFASDIEKNDQNDRDREDEKRNNNQSRERDRDNSHRNASYRDIKQSFFECICDLTHW